MSLLRTISAAQCRGAADWKQFAVLQHFNSRARRRLDPGTMFSPSKATGSHRPASDRRRMIMDRNDNTVRPVAPAPKRSLRNALMATALATALIVPAFAPYVLPQAQGGQNIS